MIIVEREREEGGREGERHIHLTGLSDTGWLLHMYNIEYNELLSIKRWPSQVMHRKKTRKPSLIQLCYICLLHHYWHWAPLTSSTYTTHILSMTYVQYVYMYQRVDS